MTPLSKLEVVEIEITNSVLAAIQQATDSLATAHILLDERTIPLLQGIGTRNPVAKGDCENAIRTILCNGYVVICPHGRAQ